MLSTRVTAASFASFGTAGASPTPICEAARCRLRLRRFPLKASSSFRIGKRISQSRVNSLRGRFPGSCQTSRRPPDVRARWSGASCRERLFARPVFAICQQ